MVHISKFVERLKDAGSKLLLLPSIRSCNRLMIGCIESIENKFPTLNTAFKCHARRPFDGSLEMSHTLS